MESSSTPSFPPSPCKDCICVPVCRFKGYFPLIKQCKLLLHLLYKSQYPEPSGRETCFDHMIYRIHNDLNPRYWRISQTSLTNDEIEIVGINLKEIGYNVP